MMKAVVEMLEAIKKRFDLNERLWSFVSNSPVVFEGELLQHMLIHPTSIRRIKHELESKEIDLSEILQELISRRIDDKLEELIELMISILLRESKGIWVKVFPLTYPIKEIQAFGHPQGKPSVNLYIANPLIIKHKTRSLLRRFADHRDGKHDAGILIEIGKPYSLYIPEVLKEQIKSNLIEALNIIFKHAMVSLQI